MLSFVSTLWIKNERKGNTKIETKFLYFVAGLFDEFFCPEDERISLLEVDLAIVERHQRSFVLNPSSVATNLWIKFLFTLKKLEFLQFIRFVCLFLYTNYETIVIWGNFITLSSPTHCISLLIHFTRPGKWEKGFGWIQ